MAVAKSTRRVSPRKRPSRPSTGQVLSLRRMAEDTERLYHELPEHEEQVLNAYVQLADWLRQFDAENPGVYADDPPAIGYSRRW